MDLILISGGAIPRILMLSHVSDVNYSVSLEILNFEVIQPWGSNYIRAAPEGGQCLVAVQLQNFSILLSKLRWGSNYPRTAPEGGQCLVAQRSNII